MNNHEQLQKEVLLQKIRMEFPTLAFAEAELIERGDDHLALILDGKVLFRFPRSEAYRSSFAEEIKLLAALRERVKVPIPEYLYLSKGNDFGGYRLIEGVRLTAERFSKLNSVQKNSIVGDIADFLTVIHTLDRNILPAYRAQEPWSGTALHEYKERYWKERRIVIAPHCDLKTLNNVDDFYDVFLHVCKDAPSCVIHGDISDDHLLFDTKRGRMSGIIDFGDAAVGDPAYDFAFFWAYGDSVAHEICRRYNAPRDKDFLERSEWHYVRYMIDRFYYNLRENAPVESIVRVALQGKLPTLLRRGRVEASARTDIARDVK